MNDVVERVARAVGRPLANMTGGCFKPDNGRSERGDCADGNCYCSRVTRHVARAAIEAMREPSPEMIAAGESKLMRGQVGALLNDPDSIWSAMIDAALADASPDIGKEG